MIFIGSFVLAFIGVFFGIAAGYSRCEGDRSWAARLLAVGTGFAAFAVALARFG